MTAQSILVVGCGFPQWSLIRRARALGLHVIGVDMNAEAIGVRDCHDFVPISTTDEEALTALVKKSGLRAITTTGSERALTATANVAHALGLPFYATPDVVRRCQEKDAMREGYRRGKVKVPPFAACTDVSQAHAFANAQSYPLVVKPSRGWGQRGVARVDGPSDLDAAVDEALGQSEAAGLRLCVLETWLQGKEYSVNAWIHDGTFENFCVTERITVPGRKPLGVMVAEVYPSGLTPEQEALVIEEARRGALALGHTRGPCYSQVVLDEGSEARPAGAYLFETAARLGGGFDADVTLLASGVNLYSRVLGVALNDRDLEAEGPTAPRHGGALAKFLIGKPGRVTAIDGIDAARSLPGVVDCEIFVRVGGTVHPLTDGAKRAGFVLAYGVDGVEATHRADAALARVRLTTESP